MILDLSNNAKKQIEHLKELNEIALELRQPFVNIIGTLSEGQDKNIDWWLTRIASRNPYESNLYLNCCNLVLIKRLLSQHKNITKIIVDSKCFSDTIKGYLKSQKIHLKVIHRSNIRFTIQFLAIQIYSIVKFLRFAVSGYFAAKKSNRKFTPDDKPLILIDTFLFNNSFKNGHYYDPYFANMLDFFSEYEKSISFYIPSLVNVSKYNEIFSKMRTSNCNFIVESEYLTFSDYVFAFLHIFRLKKIKIDRILFENIDITQLITSELKWYNFSLSSLFALLRFRLVKQLKKHNIKVHVLIDWFENQMMDRGLIQGIKHFYPNTKIIGYQGFDVIKNYQCIFPTQKEKESNIIPDIIAVTGCKKIQMIKEFCPSLKIITAPAFRFKEVWRERKCIPSADSFTVFIPLPMILKDSYEIIELVTLMAQKKIFQNLTYLFKIHPRIKPENILKRINKNCIPNFQIVDGSINDYIDKSHIVIGSISSASMEAIARGVPVIIIGSRYGLTQNPISDDIPSEIWSVCYTTDELIEKINQFKNCYNKDQEYFIKKSSSIRKDYFEPVTHDNTRRFIKIL